jgi:hypothetical protein
MFATSKIFNLILKHSHETLATCGERRCNIFTTIATWPRNDGIVGHTPRVLMQGRKKSRRRTPTRIPL